MRCGRWIINQLMSVCTASITFNELRKLRYLLTESQRTHLIRELIRLDSEAEPFEVILKRDKTYLQNVMTEEKDKHFDFDQLLVDPEEFGILVKDQREFH